MITTFHGLSAYNRVSGALELKRALDTAISGVEICAAESPLGAVGVVLFGELLEVFDRDVWSYLDDDGRRCEGGYCEKSHFGDLDQQEYEQFCATHALPGHYCEAWISAHIVRAVWVKDWTPAPLRRGAEIIARHRGVPLITVSGRTKIWDILDCERLPFAA